MIYLGGLIEGRGIEELLESFKKMSESDYVMIFMGYGNLENMIKEYTKKYNNIYLMPAVPSKEVLNYTISADIGIAYIENGSLNDKFCLPNKFFEYIFSNLPVIVNDSVEMVKIIKTYNLGVVIKNLNHIELKNAFLEIEAMNLSQLGINLEKAKKEISWNVQAKKLNISYKKLLIS